MRGAALARGKRPSALGLVDDEATHRRDISVVALGAADMQPLFLWRGPRRAQDVALIVVIVIGVTPSPRPCCHGRDRAISVE
jgi:hypothetical protein